VSGMLIVPKTSHVPAAARTSTISSRSLSPLLLFRMIAGWRAASRSTCGGAGAMGGASVSVTAGRLGRRVSVRSTEESHQPVLRSDDTTATTAVPTCKIASFVAFAYSSEKQLDGNGSGPVLGRARRPELGVAHTSFTRKRKGNGRFPLRPLFEGNVPILIRCGVSPDGS
jgi:hypothetical protein